MNIRRRTRKSIENTSTRFAPWYIVPADYKWVARTLIASIITSSIGSLNLEYPRPNEKERELLMKAKKKLESD